MGREPGPNKNPELMEFRDAELALLDRCAAVTGAPRAAIIRRGALDHARRVCAALEQISGISTRPGGVPLLQSALPPELRAAPTGGPADDDDDTNDPGGTDA